MKRVRAKLHSKGGASMVMALMFLLVCLTVGAVILTAAASNAGRIRHQRESQQDYLTVSSAARLLRSELTGLSFTTGEWQSYDSGTNATSQGLSGHSISSSRALPLLVEGLAQQVFRTQPLYVSPSGSLPAAVPLTVELSGFDGVTATLSTASNYTLSLSVFLTDSPDSYPLTLTLNAVQDISIRNDTSSYSETVQEEIDGVPTDVTYSYTITTITRTVTVTWDDGVISKGG